MLSESSEYQEASSFNSRTDLSQFHEGVNRVKAEIQKVLVGQEAMIDLLLVALMSDGHILLEGVPGVAKTLAAKLLARTLDVPFSRIQFTPDLMPSDVIGTSVFKASTNEFEFHQGPIFSHIVLIDEINRAPAKTQAALFEAMEERQVTVDGHTHPLPPPFLVIATQNPIEQEGTYRLPEAQLDRFLFKIRVSYPSAEEEMDMLSRAHERKHIKDLSLVNPILEGADITRLQQLIQGIHIDEKLRSYIVQLVQLSRNHKELYLGASPRASLNLMRSAKAVAGIAGRDFVIPDDITQVFYAVLRHRVILTPEREMEGVSTEQVLTRLINSIEVPR